MSALPNDYKEPVTSGYMKFTQGENTFRILSGIIVGMEYWKTDKGGNRKPVRKRQGKAIQLSELSVNPKTGEPDMPKHFWAMVVWNYNAKRVQILEITQQSVRKPLMALERNSKWGDLREYDVSVDRQGDGLDTTYTVTPSPKEAVKKSVVSEYEATKINLDALYDGDDPFAEPKKAGKPEAIDEVVDKARKVFR